MTASFKDIPPRTLGPVADLERHLSTDWWRNLFNSLYLKTDGDVIENEDNTRLEVDMLINSLGLTSQDSILDLCCGQGRHVLELYSRGYKKVTGVDRSRYLIRTAKKRAQQLGFSVRFSEGDARKVRLAENSLDCVVMFGNSFGYFEKLEDDLAVLNSILRVLKSNGKLAMDIVNGEWMQQHFEPRSWEWIDENHFVCRERSLSQDQTRIISREVVVHAERGVLADQFYAERLYTFPEIRKVLERLGFSQVALHGDIVASSTRNQDLGMMANRMFITAMAPQKNSKKPPLAEQKNILVLLGDPKLSDPIKRNGQFNEEDLITIKRLKESLAMLPFKFNYFDNHPKLIEQLKHAKIDLIFNLCDEGFRNEPTKELHIAALLELFNIPYTGSGPASLATCYNKAIVRAVAQSLDIPVPLETYYDPSDQAANLPSVFPALLKPNFGDSSIGITEEAVVYDSEALVSYLDKLKVLLPHTPILVQEYLVGAEYSVGLIGNPGSLIALPILIVDYDDLPTKLPKILSYESKWLPDSDYWQKIKYREAKLEVEVERQLIDNSILLFERLNCQDYARFDFRADGNGVIKLLEVNPNPGWCWDGKFNIMAGFAGKAYDVLLNMILEAAIERLQHEK